MYLQDCRVELIRLKGYSSVLLVFTALIQQVISSNGRQPLGPRMCEEICSTYSDCTDPLFDQDNLICHLTDHCSQKFHHSNLMRLDIRKNGNFSVTACPNKSRNIITKLRGQKCVKSEVRVKTSEEQRCIFCSGQKGIYSENMTLHQACGEGNLETVKYILVKKMEDINSLDKKGRTPVMVAALKGQEAIFDFLICQGSNLSTTDADHNNILHAACQGGCVNIVMTLVADPKRDVDCRGWNRWTPLMYAARNGHMGVVTLLISHGCNQTAVNRDRNNALHVACVGGHIDIVGYILAEGKLGIDCTGNRRMTPVMMAAEEGHKDLVQYLVDTGCKVKTRDLRKRNCFHLACSGGHLNTVKYIFSLRIFNVDVREGYGRTPAMMAAKNGHNHVVEYLMRSGSNRMALNDQNDTILHEAVVGGHINVVHYIISNLSVNIDCRGWRGRTPAMFAAYYGRLEVLKVLIKKGCNLKNVDADNYNILHVACSSGSVDVISYILSYKLVDINSSGQYGGTPVMVAANLNFLKVVKLLVSKGCTLSKLDRGGRDIIQWACAGGATDTINYLLSTGRVSGRSCK